MKSGLRGGPIALLLLAALLPACSTLPPAATDDPARIRLYEERQQRLAAADSWALKGRLAISNEEDGGSGTFSWAQGDSRARMDFHGALGRGAWRLVAGDGDAELELADGTVYRAATVDELVQGQLGWDIPVENLSWWVRGLAAPGDYAERVLDDAGRLTRLSQGGWSIDYGRYRDTDGVGLPLKMSATREDWKVKLAVRGWNLGAGEAQR